MNVLTDLFLSGLLTEFSILVMHAIGPDRPCDHPNKTSIIFSFLNVLNSSAAYFLLGQILYPIDKSVVVMIHNSVTLKNQ